MNEEHMHNHEHHVSMARPQGNAFAIPLAIVIAGALVAGAVLLSNRNASAGAAAPAVAAAGNQPQAAEAPADELKIRSDDHVFGNKDGDIILFEWSDPECPFCKRHDGTMEQLIAQNSDFAWVYRYFALDFHVYSKTESQSMECVASIAGEDTMHKYITNLFDTTQGNNSLHREDLTKIAQQTGGIDMEKFAKCVDSGEMAARIQKDMDSGVRAGVQGTPYTVAFNKKNGKQVAINGALPIEQINALIATIK